MAIDPTRAAFVKSEYRFETSEDTSIQATFPLAREIVMESNLDGDDAQALADTYFDEESTLKQVYQFGVERTFTLDDFADGPPLFQVELPEYATDDRIFKVTNVEVDFFTGRSVMTVRG